MTSAYYNENDAHAAGWLRNLVAAGLIPAGTVDDRSILDVEPGDLDGFSECHFFAGIGGWPLALQLAGWPANRPVWSGSCPCQPFSSAGKQSGAADERHLWPVWLRLIRQCRPDAIFGEQVAGAIGFGWLDRVFADLEAEGYTCGAAVLGAHSVGAPHIRQRLFWVADAAAHGRRSRPGDERGCEGRPALAHNGSATGRLADAKREQYDGGRDTRRGRRQFADGGATGGLDHALGPQLEIKRGLAGVPRGEGAAVEGQAAQQADAWNSAVWLPCIDGKARRVEPKYVKISDGLSGNMGSDGSKEKVNGPQSTPKPAETMRGLRKAIDPQAIQRSAGSEPELQPPEILQSGLHGTVDGRPDQSPQRPQLAQAIRQGQEGGLRTMRQDERAARSSQGPQPAEQPAVELADFVRLLPSSLALAQLSGDTATETALLALLEACGAERLVRHTSDPVQEIWRSLPCEARQRFGDMVRAGRWLRTFEHPLAVNVPARVGRLRGAGNAIVPPLAAAFVTAFMECRNEQ